MMHAPEFDDTSRNFVTGVSSRALCTIHEDTLEKQSQFVIKQALVNMRNFISLDPYFTINWMMSYGL